MSVMATTAAIAVTVGGIGRLAATDPKRRRSFGLPPYSGSRQVVLAMTAVFLPGVLLLAIGTGADFVAWLGAVCVAGWGVAAVSPLRTAAVIRGLAAGMAWPRQLLVSAAGRARGLRVAARARLRRPAAAGRAAVSPLPGAVDQRRLAELERRVAQLEAMLGVGAAASGLAGVDAVAVAEAGGGIHGRQVQDQPRGGRKDGQGRDPGEEGLHRRCSAA